MTAETTIAIIAILIPAPLVVLLAYGWPRILREFLNAWCCRPIEACIVSSGYRRAQFGYFVEIEYEFNFDGKTARSTDLGPSIGRWQPLRSFAEKQCAKFKVGGRYTAYLDEQTKRAYLEEARYDLLDRMLTPLFLLGVPLLGLLLTAFFIYGLARLLETA